MMAAPVALPIAVLLTAVFLFGGCGGIEAPDLFIVQRTGSGPGAPLTLLVNEEGGVNCNGGKTLKLNDPQIVQARVIQEALKDSRGSARHAPGATGVGAQLLPAR